MKFRMNQKVNILDGRKIDGRYNQGYIYGIEKVQDGFYLGYLSEKEFLNRFTREKYKVVYFDCVTHSACQEWFLECQLDKM